jgi:hypothetical protein
VSGELEKGEEDLRGEEEGERGEGARIEISK